MTYVYFLVVMAALDFALYASMRRRGMHRQARLMLVMAVLALAGAVASAYFYRPVV